VKDRDLYSGDNTLLHTETEVLTTDQDGEGILMYLKRSSMSENLNGQSLLRRDGVQFRSVLSPDMEILMKFSKLWNKKRTVSYSCVVRDKSRHHSRHVMEHSRQMQHAMFGGAYETGDNLTELTGVIVSLL